MKQNHGTRQWPFPAFIVQPKSYTLLAGAHDPAGPANQHTEQVGHILRGIVFEVEVDLGLHKGIGVPGADLRLVTHTVRRETVFTIEVSVQSFRGHGGKLDIAILWSDLL